MAVKKAAPTNKTVTPFLNDVFESVMLQSPQMDFFLMAFIKI